MPAIRAWRAEAERWTTGLEVVKTVTTTHDLGFMLFDSFGHGYLLTGNPRFFFGVLFGGGNGVDAAGGEAERGELADERPPGQCDGWTLGERHRFGRAGVASFGAEPLHDAPSLFRAAPGEEELGRFGNERTEQHQGKTGRQIEQPKDPPAEHRLKQRR